MQRECESCGRSYTARRGSSRFCGGTCGKRSQRARAAGIPLRAATPEDDREAAPSELERAVARELEAVGRVGAEPDKWPSNWLTVSRPLTRPGLPWPRSPES